MDSSNNIAYEKVVELNRILSSLDSKMFLFFEHITYNYMQTTSETTFSKTIINANILLNECSGYIFNSTIFLNWIEKNSNFKIKRFKRETYCRIKKMRNFLSHRFENDDDDNFEEFYNFLGEKDCFTKDCTYIMFNISEQKWIELSGMLCKEINQFLDSMELIVHKLSTDKELLKSFKVCWLSAIGDYYSKNIIDYTNMYLAGFFRLKLLSAKFSEKALITASMKKIIPEKTNNTAQINEIANSILNSNLIVSVLNDSDLYDYSPYSVFNMIFEKTYTKW